MRLNRIFIAIFTISTIGTVALADMTGLSRLEVYRVSELSQAISTLQPRLVAAKKWELAEGIYRAATHYKIDPILLMSLTYQESSFRENLPEGAHGELGICQIRKSWLANEMFRKEFPKATRTDLLKPAKNLMYGAWILSKLKVQALRSGWDLPYWSFYNAAQFAPRFRYYLAVNRHLVKLSNRGRIGRAIAIAGSKRAPRS